MTEKDVRYVMARDCGHRVWEDTHASSGIDWCPTCRKYVGVIVTRKAVP